MKSKYYLTTFGTFIIILIFLTMENSCATPGKDTLMSVAVHDTFSIDLPARFGTGYSWTIDTSYNKQVIRYFKDEVVGSSDNRDGKEEIQRFTFIALAKGTTGILFRYSRPWLKQKSEGDKEKAIKIIVK
jgi:predicted secreted protein